MPRMIESARRSERGEVDIPGEVVRLEPPVTRRTVLRRLVGVAGLATLPNLLGACGASGSTSATPSTAAGSVVPSVPPPLPSQSATSAAGLTIATILPETADVINRFTAQTGAQVRLLTEDPGSFSDQMQPYLQTAPEDVISWGAGRTSMLAIDGLLTPLDDVWAKVGSNSQPPCSNS